VEITEVAQAVSEDGALVSMMLSNSEKLIVAGLQGRARDEALFRYWTRKEAALKATGPSRIAMGAARLLIIYFIARSSHRVADSASLLAIAASTGKRRNRKR
jgi:phosphopantetheinyl transferase